MDTEHTPPPGVYAIPPELFSQDAAAHQTRYLMFVGPGPFAVKTESGIYLVTTKQGEQPKTINVTYEKVR